MSLGEIMKENYLGGDLSPLLFHNSFVFLWESARRRRKGEPTEKAGDVPADGK